MMLKKFGESNACRSVRGHSQTEHDVILEFDTVLRAFSDVCYAYCKLKELFKPRSCGFVNPLEELNGVFLPRGGEASATKT